MKKKNNCFVVFKWKSTGIILNLAEKHLEVDYMNKLRWRFNFIAELSMYLIL